MILSRLSTPIQSRPILIFILSLAMAACGSGGVTDGALPGNDLVTGTSPDSDPLTAGVIEDQPAEAGLDGEPPTYGVIADWPTVTGSGGGGAVPGLIDAPLTGAEPLAAGVVKDQPADPALDGEPLTNSVIADWPATTGPDGGGAVPGLIDAPTTGAEPPAKPVIYVIGDIRLTWIAPFEREDGTAISMAEIGGYRIYYGTAQGDYTRDLEINGADLMDATLGNLADGTYYIVITTFDTDGRESVFSPELVVSKSSGSG